MATLDWDILEKYVPKESIPFIQKWLQPYTFKLIIKRSRKGKLGDYRLPHQGKIHQITVNNDLSHELCFLTLTHEIAHLIAYDKFGRKILPHGIEWKKTFSLMMIESINIYPADLKPIIINSSKNPKASFYADKYLAKYFLNEKEDHKVLVSELPYSTSFKIGSKIFKIIEKRRTRFLCLEIKTQKKYLVSGIAKVEIYQKNI